jgi:lambda repressor-like predicted transcriptional regulator
MVDPHKEVVRCLRVVLVALCVRTVGAWLLGEGAVFGPDGTGAEAAVVLGGHPYPAHIVLLKWVSGDARALSMLCSSISCGLLWLWGRRVGLGGAGGWLAVSLPLSVFPGVLAAGDAPALMVVLLGVVLTTFGGAFTVIGGVIAAVSVAIKPIALAGLVLLLVRPMAVFGALSALLLLRGFIRPLWAPMPQGGLLGTWWVSSDGAPPEMWLSWLGAGAWRIVDAPAWGVCWIFWLGALAVLFTDVDKRLRVAALGVTASAILVGAMFGSRMELRYLSASFVVMLPFLGAVIRTRRTTIAAVLLGAWPTLALLTQLGAERADRDTDARVPTVPVVLLPSVEVGPIFDACSVDDATRWRNLAIQLAEVAPRGSTIIAEALPDGREGEIIWPLRVLRPDLKVQTRHQNSEETP